MRRLAAAVLLLCAVAPGCADGQRAAPPPPTAPSSSGPSSSSTTQASAVSLPTVTYGRGGGRSAPPDHERLEIASDGAFSLQRSVRSPTVGRFRGQLTPAEQEGLAGDARAALAAGSLTAKRLPDAAGETITVDSTSASFGGGLPSGPWGALAARLQALVVDLVRSPVAAVTVAVAPDAAGAHLSHVGSEPVTVVLARLAVTVVLLGSDGSEVSRWASPPPAAPDAGPTIADPGWSLPLPFPPDLVRHPGETLQVSARFGLVNGTERIDVLATTSGR